MKVIKILNTEYSVSELEEKIQQLEKENKLLRECVEEVEKICEKTTHTNGINYIYKTVLKTLTKIKGEKDE